MDEPGMASCTVTGTATAPAGALGAVADTEERPRIYPAQPQTRPERMTVMSAVAYLFKMRLACLL